MPDQKISEDDPILALSNTMYLPIVDPDEPDATNQNKRVTVPVMSAFFVVSSENNEFTGSNEFQSTVELGAIVIKSYIETGAETLPDGYIYYYLDGEAVSTALPSIVDGQEIIIINDTPSTRITLTGLIRQNGTNLTSVTMRGGTTAKFHARNGRWNSFT